MTPLLFHMDDQPEIIHVVSLALFASAGRRDNAAELLFREMEDRDGDSYEALIQGLVKVRWKIVCCKRDCCNPIVCSTRTLGEHLKSLMKWEIKAFKVHFTASLSVCTWNLSVCMWNLHLASVNEPCWGVHLRVSWLLNGPSQEQQLLFYFVCAMTKCIMQCHFEPEWVCPPSTNYFLMVVVQCTPHASRSIIFTNPLLTCLFSSYCVVFSSSHWDVQPTAVHTSGERRAGGMDEGHGKMIRTLKWMENRNACVTELEFVQIKSTCDKLSLSFRVFWGRWAVERL